MRKSRYTEEQIIGFIKQAECGLPALLDEVNAPVQAIEVDRGFAGGKEFEVGAYEAAD
ncbi:hypothetical protein M2282_003579 [Variovorax boronicumulans]|nr:hypothetical protein [Variovorax boronicumulans]